MCSVWDVLCFLNKKIHVLLFSLLFINSGSFSVIIYIFKIQPAPHFLFFLLFEIQEGKFRTLSFICYFHHLLFLPLVKVSCKPA